MSLWECVDASLLSASPSMPASFPRVAASQPALPLIGETGWPDPASRTLRQLECWIIWAVSGPVSLWALLYILCKH